jgi:hypothetical protein
MAHLKLEKFAMREMPLTIHNVRRDFSKLAFEDMKPEHFVPTSLFT